MHDWSLLHIIVREEVSKETIHIKRADGSCYLPPAEANPPFPRGMAPPIILPNHFRENLHVCRQADIRSIHLTTGEATFPVPAGRHTLWISRGHELRSVQRAFTVRPGQTAHIDVPLKRIEAMQGRGWVSGDMHVHFTRRKPIDDLILAHLMLAEDLPAVNNMVYKADGKVLAPQRTMGHRETHYQLRHDHQILAGGEEFRDNDLYGHMIAAGISSTN